MKNLYAILLAFVCLCANLHAQNLTTSDQERLYTFMYQNKIYAAAPTHDGGWVLGLDCASNIIHYASDSLFVAIVDKDTELKRNFRINAGGWYELIHFEQIFYTPDHRIVCVFNLSACDVGSTGKTVVCFDTLGQQQWQLDYEYPWDATTKWQMKYDTALVRFFNGTFYYLNTYDGTMIEEHTNINATEFVHMDFENHKFYEKTPSTLVCHYYDGDTSYISWIFPFVGTWGDYAIDTTTNNIFVWEYGDYINYFNLNDPSFIYTRPSPDLDAEFVDLMAYDGDVLVLMTKPDDPVAVWRYNHDNQAFTRFWEVKKSNKKPNLSLIHGNKLTIFGQENYGFNTDYYTYDDVLQNRHGWLLQKDLINETKPAKKTDIQLVRMIQNEPLKHNGYWVLNSGDFDVEIRNVGDDTIRSVYVNSFLGWDPFNMYCGGYEAQQVRIDGFVLPPNETTIINMGKIDHHYKGRGFPALCFWISAPNDKPDDSYVSGWDCIQVDYLVSTDGPLTDTTPQLWPNPSSGHFNVQIPPHTRATTWRMYDPLGRTVREGTMPQGVTLLEVQANGLPAGLYWIQVEAMQAIKMVLTD
jgi:Secretion system C-terminal sorting domain